MGEVVERFWHAVDRTVILVGGLIVLVATLHVAADVILKYLFASPIPGTIVWVSNYYMVAIVFLPLVSTELRNQHISVDLWPRVTPALDRLAMRLTWALSAAVFALLAWNTWRDAARKYGEGEFALDQGGTVITWPGYFVLPLGFALITALLIAKTVRPTIKAAPAELPADV